MKIFEKITRAIAAFRAVEGIELPDTGRSSVETLSGALSAYLGQVGSVSPIIDFEMLETLKRLYIWNPDFSQYVANIVNLGNPGHKLMIEAKTDSTITAAIDRANEAASRLYPSGAGVDGLFNQYLTDIAWGGAISSEDVVNFQARRVEKVVNVPIEQIRFVYNKDTDSYEPFQRNINFAVRTGALNPLGLIRLNPETYQYFALSTIQNSPYAKPPATAAIEPILLGQKPIMENIQYIAQRFGLLGLVSVALQPPPKRPNEDESVYQARAKKYQVAVRDSLQGQFKDGLLVAFKDQKIEHTDISQGATGVDQINTITEQQVFSAMAAMPGFHGRTDSTTETFADVVYYLLLAQMGNMQRLVKRRHERTLRLDFRLGGIDVVGISLMFNKAHSRNALQEAQTKRLEWQIVKEKVVTGLIDADAGAQELGYDSWEDPEKLFGDGLPSVAADKSLARFAGRKTIKLSFDKNSQVYRYQPEVLRLASGDDDGGLTENVLPFGVKKKRLIASH